MKYSHPTSNFRLLCSLCLIWTAQIQALVAQANQDDLIDQWHGYTRRTFQCDGRTAWIVEPKEPLPGRPWSWCMEFPDAFTERCAALQLLENGFHHAHIAVGNTYGAPEAMEHFKAFHSEAVRRGLAHRAALIGISRGCLYAHRFAAAHPDKVSVIYGDAGVCDIKSWPGGKGNGKGSPTDWSSLLKLYGFKDEVEALAWKGNPIDTLEPLAKAGIPLIYVVGDADMVVPAEENALVIEKRYRSLGGMVKVIHKPGVGHHPHGLADPTPVVDFILKAHKIKPATRTPINANWETIRMPPLHIEGHPAHAHTQGLEIHMGNYLVTARRDDITPRRALLLRTNPSASGWDVWDITPNNEDGEPTPMDHPGGMQSDGNHLWIPLAESRRGGHSLIRAFPLAEMTTGGMLQWDKEIGVRDHIGAVAVDGERRRIYGASWDTEIVYVWSYDGELIRRMQPSDLDRRALGISSDRPNGVAVQDWKFVGNRILASGLRSSDPGGESESRSTLLSIHGFESEHPNVISLSIPTFEGVEMAREGMTTGDGWIYLIPEDLGTSNRLFRFKLRNLNLPSISPR